MPGLFGRLRGWPQELGVATKKGIQTDVNPFLTGFGRVSDASGADISGCAAFVRESRRPDSKLGGSGASPGTTQTHWCASGDRRSHALLSDTRRRGNSSQEGTHAQPNRQADTRVLSCSCLGQVGWGRVCVPACSFAPPNSPERVTVHQYSASSTMKWSKPKPTCMHLLVPGQWLSTSQPWHACHQPLTCKQPVQVPVTELEPGGSIPHAPSSQHRLSCRRCPLHETTHV